jgi:hypothetical protein
MALTTTLGAGLGALAGCVPAVIVGTVGALSGNNDGQFGLGLVFLAIIGAPIGMVAGAIGGVMVGAKKQPRTVASPSLGLTAGGTVTLAAVLGTVAGCAPAVALLIICPAGARNDPEFQFGLALTAEIIIGAPFGIVTGLVGGAIYCANQRLLTAASPCLGLMTGGIIGVTINPWYFIWLAPTAGGLLGVFIAILTWRRGAEPSPPLQRAARDVSG